MQSMLYYWFSLHNLQYFKEATQNDLSNGKLIGMLYADNLEAGYTSILLHSVSTCHLSMRQPWPVFPTMTTINHLIYSTSRQQ